MANLRTNTHDAPSRPPVVPLDKPGNLPPSRIPIFAGGQRRGHVGRKASEAVVSRFGVRNAKLGKVDGKLAWVGQNDAEVRRQNELKQVRAQRTAQAQRGHSTRRGPERPSSARTATGEMTQSKNATVTAATRARRQNQATTSAPTCAATRQTTITTDSRRRSRHYGGSAMSNKNKPAPVNPAFSHMSHESLRRPRRPALTLPASVRQRWVRRSHRQVPWGQRLQNVRTANFNYHPQGMVKRMDQAAADSAFLFHAVLSLPSGPQNGISDRRSGTDF